ncbi:ATP-dependent endonuclease [Streptomyces sp. NPDC002328]|uniref:ATP-dependent nuclease n=1 Tax=Streptomyces sp. NPDC002328 TaxID=3364642 RepID=UPI003696258B
MSVSFGVAELRLSDGTVVTPPTDGMTVFIGPNNSGKSLLLRELATLIQHFPGTLEPRRWVAGIELRSEGSSTDLIQWLNDRGHEARYDPVRQRTSLPNRPGEREPGPEVGQVEALWSQRRIGELSHLLVTFQQTGDRLQNQTDSYHWDQSISPSHPTQALWESRERHAKFSGLFEAAFGEPISINRFDPNFRLQVGSTGMDDTPPPAPPHLREAYAKLPYLNDQGDGMRAFVNLVLHTLVRPTPVIIIDEPEAFLHPPQARLLGKYLAMHTPSPCQIFVSTHSADFLSGVLDGSSVRADQPHRPLALIRLSRTSSAHSAKTLAPELVEEILNSPLLRYSNIVSGLFHDGVVLCEAEGDCQFYEATFDVVRGGGRHENLTFLHVNGKARLSDAAEKLRTCGIPTAVVADFDFLNDRTKLTQALSALGGNWADVKEDFSILHEYARSDVITKPATEIKKSIAEIIGNTRGKATLEQGKVDQIIEILKTANNWKTLKKSGLGGLNGEIYRSTKRLLEYFAKRGIFVVPVGELECWVRSVSPSNKGQWLRTVFEEGHYRSPIPELQIFAGQISSYLLGHATCAENCNVDTQ